MIIKYKNDTILEIYKKYLNSLNVEYNLNESNGLVINNTLKIDSVKPLQYSTSNIVTEQIIFFLQLLSQKNYSILYFNPCDFEIGITSSKNLNQKGGATIERIEDKILDSRHHEENYNLEKTEIIPFIIFKNTKLILETNETDGVYLILYNDIDYFKKQVTMGSDFYSFYKKYTNTILLKINNKQYEDIYFKESYESLAFFLLYLIVNKNTTLLNEHQIKNMFLNTPLYFCIERLMVKDSASRFLFLL